MVSCQNISKSFGSVSVVQSLYLDVPEGKIVALLGPSGCGKTTTLRLIAGLERVDEGEIVIAGRVVADGRNHVPIEKRRVGMVFQDYAIFPHLSVAHNVGFGLGRNGHKEARVAEMLNFVGLGDLGERMPHELSGGQQQRVALARAIAPQPDVLLMDEPFSNLDAALRQEMRYEVRDLLQKAGVTAVFVTHDQEEALFMGDWVAVMNEGRMEQIGTPEQIFHHPQTRFVADFIGQTDFVVGTVTAAGLQTPLGLIPRPVALPEGTSVELALRADDVTIAKDEQGNGRIIGRQFLGIAYVYRVGLADGSIVHSWQPHGVQLAQGTAVRVGLAGEHPPVCFYNGRAI